MLGPTRLSGAADTVGEVKQRAGFPGDRAVYHYAQVRDEETVHTFSKYKVIKLQNRHLIPTHANRKAGL